MRALTVCGYWAAVAAVPTQEGHAISAHVDDVQQIIVAGSQLTARISTVMLNTTFGNAIRASALSPSTKFGGSVALSSIGSVAEQVASDLRTQGSPCRQ